MAYITILWPNIPNKSEQTKDNHEECQDSWQ